jgi:hypothetical protein
MEAQIEHMAKDVIEQGMDDEQLAGRIVGLLIHDKGSLNAYQRTIEVVIKLLRHVEHIKSTTKLAVSDDNYVSGHAVAREAAMKRWEASLRRADLDDRTRVQGAIDAYERQLFAFAVLPSPTRLEIAVAQDPDDGQKA